MPQNLIEKLPDIEVHPGHVSKAEFRRKKFIREHRDVKRRWRNLTTFEWMNIRVVFSSAIDKARLIDDA